MWPVFAVLYKLTNVYSLRIGSALKILVSRYGSTVYKPDTSLRRTVRAGPEGVRLLLLERVDCAYT